MLGNERVDEFARNGAELHARDKSDVATLAVWNKLVKRVPKTLATVLALFPAQSAVLRLLDASRPGRVPKLNRLWRGSGPFWHAFQ